jgi:hypothetical protein
MHRISGDDRTGDVNAVQQHREHRDLVRLRAHVHLAQDGATGVVEGSQQVLAGFGATGRTAQRLAVHRDDPPGSRPWPGGLLRPGAGQVIESIRVQALQGPPERRLRWHHARDSQHAQGLLVRIRGPFRDRPERACRPPPRTTQAPRSPPAGSAHPGDAADQPPWPAPPVTPGSPSPHPRPVQPGGRWQGRSVKMAARAWPLCGEPGWRRNRHDHHKGPSPHRYQAITGVSPPSNPSRMTLPTPWMGNSRPSRPLHNRGERGPARTVWKAAPALRPSLAP